MGHSSPAPPGGYMTICRWGLIPRLNWYREDLVPDDVDLAGAPELPVDALLISHAHMDHFGCAGFLDMDIPFVASPMTAALIKAMNDSGSAGPGAECVYSTRKVLGRDRRTLILGRDRRQPGISS